VTALSAQDVCRLCPVFTGIMDKPDRHSWPVLRGLLVRGISVEERASQIAAGIGQAFTSCDCDSDLACMYLRLALQRGNSAVSHAPIHGMALRPQWEKEAGWVAAWSGMIPEEETATCRPACRPRYQHQMRTPLESGQITGPKRVVIRRNRSIRFMSCSTR
jgi:hypothetical protein